MARVGFSMNEGATWSPLPDGTYDFQINEVKEARSKNDNPQINLKAAVVGGPHDGKTTIHWFTLTPKAAWRLRDLLDACDVDYDQAEATDGEADCNVEFDTDDLLGRYFRAECTTSEYNGNKKNDFNKYDVSAVGAEEEVGEAKAAAAPKAAPTAAPAAQAAGGVDPAEARRAARAARRAQAGQPS